MAKDVLDLLGESKKRKRKKKKVVRSGRPSADEPLKKPRQKSTYYVKKSRKSEATLAKEITREIKRNAKERLKALNKELEKVNKQLEQNPNKELKRELKKKKKSLEGRIATQQKRLNTATATGKERARKQEAARLRRNERARQKRLEEKNKEAVDAIKEGQIVYDHLKLALEQYNDDSNYVGKGKYYWKVQVALDTFISEKGFEEAMAILGSAPGNIVTEFWISLHYEGEDNYTGDQIEASYIAFNQMIEERPMSLEQLKNLQEEKYDFSRTMNSTQAADFSSLFDEY